MRPRTEAVVRGARGRGGAIDPGGTVGASEARAQVPRATAAAVRFFCGAMFFGISAAARVWILGFRGWLVRSLS
jgi:hypothetical protein